MRRDKLNDRFLELGSILDPGRPLKMDKALILGDTVRMVTKLREEAQMLKESKDSLQDKINELKAEKNEIRDEKQRLKSEKENLEWKVKAMSCQQPSFLSHPPAAMPAPFPIAGQGFGGKMVPFMGYPGVSMWQFMPPAVVDTSQDHVLRPPVAQLFLCRHRYRQVGNAVAVPVGRALGYALGMAEKKQAGEAPLMTLPPKFSLSTTVELLLQQSSSPCDQMNLEGETNPII